MSRRKWHYILDADGKTPIEEPDLIKYVEWLEAHHEQCSVARDAAGPYEISTVFLGTNHNWRGTGPPVLWETMIFGDEGDGKFGGLAQRRYASYDDAVAGHRYFVAAVRQAVIN